MAATPPRDSPERCFSGFLTLDMGMSGGTDPSLIGKNQFSAACNMTIRGDLIKTRPPYANHIFTDETEGRFTGRFQGAQWYDGQNGQSCHVIARGGKLFRLTLGMENILTEITPRLTIVTTEDFTVPAPAATVLVEVVSETAIATGDTIFIDSGEYTVTNRSANELALTFVGGDTPGDIVLSGAAVLDSSHVQILEWRQNPDWLEFVYFVQAETFMLVFCGQHRTIVFDGSQSRQLGVGELPAGTLGAYGWGRVWVCLPNRRTFVAGDIAFGNGDAANLLNFTENDYLNEGGSFAVPYNAGPITSMQFLSQMDTSLGIGVLLVGTTNTVFSVNAPVDRDTWKNLTYPIQTISLIDYGPEGPRSTLSMNGDMLYRCQDGWRTFITAHRYFQTPGNTPISHEIEPLLAYDTPSLLFFSTGMLFNNRILQSISPTRTSNGIQHRGLAVMNLDLLSQVAQKQPPAYEGAWTGLNIFQMVKGRINGNERGFAWVDNDGTFELWEFLQDNGNYYDQFTQGSGDTVSITRTPIESWMESRSDNFDIPFEKKKLKMAELYVDDVIDSVTIQVQFKPDQYPIWTNWGPLITLCANVSLCDPPNTDCAPISVTNPGYKSRITLPQPPETCSLNNDPINLGYEFQSRIEITGHCQIRRFRTHAIIVPTPMEGHTACEEIECVTLTGCGTDYFNYSSR